MRKIKFLFGIIAIGFMLNSCEIDGLDSDTSFINDIQTAQQNGVIDVTNDNSGKVIITPVAEGITKSVVHFGGGAGDSTATVAPGANVSHVYPEGSYTVTIDYYNAAGQVTSKTYPFTITYRIPENLNFIVEKAGHTITLEPKADYANGFEVYFGEAGNQTPIIIPAGAKATYTYAAGGDYTVRVVALSGGQAKTERSETITVFDPFSLPVTFENPLQYYNIGGTFGGVGAEIIDNPFSTGINTSSKIWKFVKSQGAETWGGTWTPMGTKININDGKKFKIMVYATETGKSIHFQLEDGTDYKPAVDVPITVANQWQELTFDFSSLNIADGHLFNQFVVQYNLSENGQGEVIYLDNISQTN